jgi:hypothetical protein
MRAAESLRRRLALLFFLFFIEIPTRILRVGITGTYHRPCYLWWPDIILTFSMKMLQLRSGMAVVVGDGVCVPVPILRPVASCIE